MGSGRECKLEDILKMQVKAFRDSDFNTRNVSRGIGVSFNSCFFFFLIIAIKLETNCASGSRGLVI